MKYLLAFALIAVASALPEPMRLLEPVQVAQPDIAPFILPGDVTDNVALLVKFVEEAGNADALEAVYASETFASDYAVNFVDEAVNADAPEAVIAPETDDASAYAVNFVEEAVNADAPEDVIAPETLDASAYAVNFVDEAVNAEAAEVNEDAPLQIKIINIPLPDSVVLPLAQSIVLPSIDAVKIAESPLETNSADYAVKFVDVANVDEETPSYRPIKVYDDARLR